MKAGKKNEENEMRFETILKLSFGRVYYSGAVLKIWLIQIE